MSTTSEPLGFMTACEHKMWSPHHIACQHGQMTGTLSHPPTGRRFLGLSVIGPANALGCWAGGRKSVMTDVMTACYSSVMTTTADIQSRIESAQVALGELLALGAQKLAAVAQHGGGSQQEVLKELQEVANLQAALGNVTVLARYWEPTDA